MKKEATTPKWEIVKKCTGEGYIGKGCGAEFPVKENDVCATFNGVNLLRTTFYCKCPICGNCTQIPIEEVPDFIIRKLLLLE